MLISQREACELLASARVTPRHARRVLASGLAGAPIRTRSALLYDERAVKALAARPIYETAHLWERSPVGFFVARRDVSSDHSRARLLQDLAGGWGAVSPVTWIEMVWHVRDLVETHRCGLPFVCTVAGFVVLGAEIVGSGREGLMLADPGPWFDGLAEARLLVGPGRPWSIHLGGPEDAPRERIGS